MVELIASASLHEARDSEALVLGPWRSIERLLVREPGFTTSSRQPSSERTGSMPATCAVGGTPFVSIASSSATYATIRPISTASRRSSSSPSESSASTAMWRSCSRSIHVRGQCTAGRRRLHHPAPEPRGLPGQRAVARSPRRPRHRRARKERAAPRTRAAGPSGSAASDRRRRGCRGRGRLRTFRAPGGRVAWLAYRLSRPRRQGSSGISAAGGARRNRGYARRQCDARSSLASPPRCSCCRPSWWRAAATRRRRRQPPAERTAATLPTQPLSRPRRASMRRRCRRRRGIPVAACRFPPISTSCPPECARASSPPPSGPSASSRSRRTAISSA